MRLNGVCNIADFGAKGDGVGKNTRIIQNAIDQCGAAGGGIVFFPPGNYISGTLYLRDNICLELAPGAVLTGSPDREDYNADDFCPQNRISREEHAGGGHLIVALEVSGITIRGGGRIDGAREKFMNKTWSEFPTVFEMPEWRPGQMLFFCECHNITISDIELYHAPYWSCLLHGCDDVNINGVRIWNDQRTHNGDGIDIDCCRRVTVSNCDIDSGDDCITLRANYKPLKKHRSVCENVTVANCVMRTTRCNAIRIGVGDGIIRNCLFSNIVIHDSRTGICVIARYLSENQVEISDIMFENIILDTQRAFVISSCITGPCDQPSKMISGLSFNHIRARCRHTALIQGNTDRNIREISFQNSRFEFHGGNDIPENREEFAKVTGETSFVKTSSTAIWLKNCREIEFRNVKVKWHDNIDGPWERAIELSDADPVTVEQCVLENYVPTTAG